MTHALKVEKHLAEIAELHRTVNDKITPVGTVEAMQRESLKAAAQHLGALTKRDDSTVKIEFNADPDRVLSRRLPGSCSFTLANVPARAYACSAQETSR